MLGTPEAALGDRRQPTGDEPGWHERWYADWVTPSAPSGVFELTLWPHRGCCALYVGIVGAGRPPVVLVDDALPVPRSSRLELRGAGVWLDLAPLVPLEHLTIQLEAFAMAIDRDGPVDLGTRGQRVPLALDLEWETEGFLRTAPGDQVLACRVIGEVWVADARAEISGSGVRRHRWGSDCDWPEVAPAVDRDTLVRLPAGAVPGVSSSVAAGPTLVSAPTGERRLGTGWMRWSHTEAD